MAVDHLAKFRKGTSDKPAAAEPTQETGGLLSYVAFEAKDKIKRLEIRRVMGAYRTPAYAYLLDIVFDGLHGTELVLLYSFMMIKIKGENLHPVTLAIQKGNCDFIQDFDPRAFAGPAPDAPRIDHIEIIVKGGEDQPTG
jgi:hypothetical protein